MQMRTQFATAVTVLALITASGCAVTRGQETTGAYIDDTAITTSVKTRFIDNKEVDASSIKVETLNGTVMLSGFAKNQAERATAERLGMQYVSIPWHCPWRIRLRKYSATCASVASCGRIRVRLTNRTMRARYNFRVAGASPAICKSSINCCLMLSLMADSCR